MNSVLSAEQVAHILSNKYGRQPSGSGFSFNSHCPSHDDENGSLSVSDSDGKLLVNCHAGCDQSGLWEAVKSICGLSKDNQIIEAIYPYLNAHKELQFEKVRFVPKDFRFRRPDGNGGYIWKLGTADGSLLYNLPNVADAISKNETVWIVEGEKDCDNLANLGIVATCNAHGASEDTKKPKWSFKNTAWLKGLREAIIIPDNDSAGRAHAQAIAASLTKTGISCKIVALPGLPEKGDVSDWIRGGGTKSKLDSLAEQAPEWLLDPIEKSEPGNHSPESPSEHHQAKGQEIHRWPNASVPFPYKLTSKGLVKTSEEKPQGELIAGPVCAVANTSNPDGADAGLVLEADSRDGRQLLVPIPRTRLYEDASILSKDLANLNFYIKPGKEKELLKYLADCEPADNRIAVTQTGWARSTDAEKLVYVLPNSATEPGYHFQPERFAPSTYTVKSCGTLEQWADHVLFGATNITASACGAPNFYSLFAVLVALSGPLLKFAPTYGTGGIHFWGDSSSGKTTLAQVAASTWGNGADPSDSAGTSYIRRWNATATALEVLASSSNDMLLIVDEVGSYGGKDYAKGIYDLSSGVGKDASNPNRTLNKQRAWRLSIISTGEISSQVRIEQDSQGFGRKSHAKAGQLLRLIDIQINSNMFAGRDEVDKLKRACGLYYGTLGAAFVRYLCEKFTNTSLLNNVQVLLDSSLIRLAHGKGKLTAIQERALKRFALAEVAGKILAHSQIVPRLTSSHVELCIGSIKETWLPFSGQMHDAERAIAALRDYILRYRDSRFKNTGETIGTSGVELKEAESARSYNEIAGYYNEKKNTFFLLPATIREATGVEPEIVARYLNDHGLLKKDRGDRNAHRLTINKTKIDTYGVKALILGKSADTEDADP